MRPSATASKVARVGAMDSVRDGGASASLTNALKEDRSPRRPPAGRGGMGAVGVVGAVGAGGAGGGALGEANGELMEDEDGRSSCVIQ